MKKVHGEGHVSIPWWGWLAVGIVMTVYSKTVEIKNPNAAGIVLFFYLGIIIAIIGLGKLVVERKKGEALQQERKEEKKYSHQLQRQEQQWQHQKRQQQHPTQHNIIKCPACGAQHYATSNFCHRCGARLK